MRKTVRTSPHEYTAQIKCRFDSRLSLGEERFVGWCLGPFFSISYYSGKELGRRNYPIANKALGFVTGKEGDTVVSYFLFYGLTDPVSLLLLFLGTLLIFVSIGAPSPVLFAVGWTAAMALLTGLCSAFSFTGQDGAARLKEFLFPTKP